MSTDKRKAQYRAYYHKNKDRICKQVRKQFALRTEDERQKYNAKQLEYYHKHRKQCRIKQNAYRQSHKKQCREYDKKRYLKFRKERLAKSKEYRYKHPKKVRNTRLKTRYGITLKDYYKLKRNQSNKCAICGQRKKKLVIDHCHITGKVRGLLCVKCNTYLGYIQEDISALKAAVKYLQKQ